MRNTSNLYKFVIRSAFILTVNKVRYCSIRTNMNFTSSSMGVHKVCRNSCYFQSGSKVISRLTVPDDKVLWSSDWPDYNPPCFTLEGMSSKPWADPDIGTPCFNPKWNQIDGKVNRCSHVGSYEIVDGHPRNICGRTGLKGRGRLGRWGPNHAADPVVTKWKRKADGSIDLNPFSNLPVFQFIAIKRQDCGKWAIPGGMVDPGEVVTTTLKREFCEEAMNSLSLSDEEKLELEKSVSIFFNTGKVVYKGYVDDPRNTDNAWMETVVSNFHDESGEVVGKFPLQAGDDASQVQWVDYSSNLELYANHVELLKQVALLLKAHC